ncbi:MAG: hypothetical protein J7J99_01550 [Thermoprotei archaeon]|nr:hypothetical protein [Thermoprotei archaeon]
MRSNLLKYIFVEVILSALIVFSFLINFTPVQASPDRYYVGYEYYGYNLDTEYAPYGVLGYIITISPEIPEASNFLAQWVCVIISYTRQYWIQVGYVKSNGLISDTFSFYIEVQDELGYRRSILNIEPEVGTAYRYDITGYFSASKGYVWSVGIRKYGEISDVYRTDVETYPYESHDLQAMSEMTSTTICINGTHFWDLSYWDGRSWPYWNRHVPEDSLVDPYHLVEVSDHEFYAYGGG